MLPTGRPPPPHLPHRRPRWQLPAGRRRRCTAHTLQPAHTVAPGIGRQWMMGEENITTRVIARCAVQQDRAGSVPQRPGHRVSPEPTQPALPHQCCSVSAVMIVLPSLIEECLDLCICPFSKIGCLQFSLSGCKQGGWAAVNDPRSADDASVSTAAVPHNPTCSHTPTPQRMPLAAVAHTWLPVGPQSHVQCD